MFEELAEIGSGTYGRVVKVNNIFNHKVYALKLIELSGNLYDSYILYHIFIRI